MYASELCAAVEQDATPEQIRAAAIAEVQRVASSAAAMIDSLPGPDLQLLLSLRTGRHRWRLDTLDWGRLAGALKLDRAADDTVASIPHVARVVLHVLLRGQMVAERSRVRSNPALDSALWESVQELPDGDADMLLDKWRTLGPDFAARAAHRVLRYARLAPAVPPGGAEAASGEALERTQRFVAAQLLQVLLERMPSSWVAWSSRVVQSVELLAPERLQVLADALSLPHAINDAALMHVVLQLVSPERLDSLSELPYIEECREVRAGIG
jgi:hypothetical protein